jgi:hypothetical protein
LIIASKPTALNNILINYSADVLAQQKDGMTWTQIARFFRKKSVEYNVDAPYVNTIFPSHLGTRRVGFIENLKVFSSDQQLILLSELCNLKKNNNIAPLKKLLMIHCIKRGFMVDQNNVD